MQTVTDWLELISSVILVVVTAVYVYLTKRMLEESRKQSALRYTPVLGIDLSTVGISEVFGPNRRNMSPLMSISNVGNAPAIQVLVDGEIILEYSDIEGFSQIPSRFKPRVVPIIRPEETVDDEKYAPNFGNTCVTHVLDDFRECNRLNKLRIEEDPTQSPYMSTKIRIILYYRNSLGQYFESTYEAFLWCEDLPKEDEIAELHVFARPKFRCGPISEGDMKAKLKSRNEKRDLSGW